MHLGKWSWSSNNFRERGREMRAQIVRVPRSHASGRFGGVRSWAAVSRPSARQVAVRLVLVVICTAPILVLLFALSAMMGR
jgi:hypothetical protein